MLSGQVHKGIGGSKGIRIELGFDRAGFDSEGSPGLGWFNSVFDEHLVLVVDGLGEVVAIVPSVPNTPSWASTPTFFGRPYGFRRFRQFVPWIRGGFAVESTGAEGLGGPHRSRGSSWSILIVSGIGGHRSFRTEHTQFDVASF